MTKKKKITIAALSIVLVIACTLGFTLAYMTRLTEKRSNNFSFGGDTALNAKLTEPSWDGIRFYEINDDGTVTPVYEYLEDDPEQPVYGYVNGDPTRPVTDKNDIDSTTDKPRYDGVKYGAEESVNMIPGRVAPKNPFITNTGNLCDEWVAAKITFVYAAGSANAGKPLSATDLANVLDCIEIDYNSDSGAGAKWERIESDANSLSQTFYYKEILEKASTDAVNAEGGKTESIFTTVKVIDEASAASIKKIYDIGGFAIYIEGFAAQSTVSTDYAGFKTWAETGVVFDNTPTDENPAPVDQPIVFPAQ